MPSAANVKIDKQISSENALPDPAANNSTPLRQAITIIEHKIRNLEKRKVSCTFFVPYHASLNTQVSTCFFVL